jgi:hypothetical protein
LTAYDKPEDVPKARLTDEEKEECLVMQGEENIGPCEESSDDFQAAKDAFAAQWQITSTGLVFGDPNEESSLLYPSTEKEYELIGSEEEQEKVNGLKSFQPGMVGRRMVPVRNQGHCGSCYSFAAANTITSSYAQENPDSEFLQFSNQHFMNCLPVSIVPLLDNNTGVEKAVQPFDSGTGCWGGLASKVIDMVVYLGGKLPLLEEEPYIGFHGRCNLDGTNWVDTGKSLCVYDVYVKLLILPQINTNTNCCILSLLSSHTLVLIGITGYSTIKSVKEMKNALYFRGDVAISYNAAATDSQAYSLDPEDENIKMPPNDIDLHEQANLGKGSSFLSDGSRPNHAVAIVGWGPCQVTEVSVSTRDDYIFNQVMVSSSHTLFCFFILISARQMRQLMTPSVGSFKTPGVQVRGMKVSFSSIQTSIVMQALSAQGKPLSPSLTRLR